jgi:hypothetical protein
MDGLFSLSCVKPTHVKVEQKGFNMQQSGVEHSAAEQSKDSRLGLG